MLVTEIKRNTLATKLVEERQHLPGRMLTGTRFHTITLDKQDVQYLLHNPEYLKHLLLHFHASTD